MLRGLRVLRQLGRKPVDLDHGCMFSVACPLDLQGLNRGQRWIGTVEPGRKGRVVRFALEGNIASGKSTLLELIRTEFKVFTVQEPVGKWQEVEGDGGSGAKKGSNLLELFYADPKRWAYTFQTYAFLSRLQSQTILPPSDEDVDVICMERSVLADYHIFAKNCHKSGLFNDMEWSLYRQWFEWLAEKFPPVTHGTIYVRASPAVCLQRLHKRARGEEVPDNANISIEYLEQLHARHEEWLLAVPGGPAGKERDAKKNSATRALGALDLCHGPVLVLDADADFGLAPAAQERALDQVRIFISQLRDKSAADRRQEVEDGLNPLSPP